MAHQYGQPVAVIRAADGTPAHFRWKGSEWPVSEVFETWHLMDRSPKEADVALDCVRCGPYAARVRSYPERSA